MSVLPSLPEVPGTDPSRCVLDTFRIAIAQKVAAVFPQLSIEQVYQGVDYGKKGIDFTVALPRFRLPGKVDALAKQVIDQVRRNLLLLCRIFTSQS
jgi:arginyl-tRNA synthetase